ncbi:MAG: SRPBCC domain-containing protein [Alphaproteobacteria bacterium]|nr:SRPBCC domain-containing protein [Alphaproteobacteria bacterium]MBU1515750.1 SRPBCC domain-containing protein [Alphaproteobacteria bacterium]MBU2097033.1 SRPBCC domain-containing protein [Alphaproteobacteria bacterium]MBU2149549.1 SRPBCC domain-containing protein [Alphaproteobacteria bacterium]MBU2308935.1 SRPBCC domain-containing protein [Alphaproteobacteria bacterium]
MAELTVTHRYPFAAEKVFDAWLDPKIASRFLFTAPGGEIVRCDIDARPGGRFTIVDRREDMGGDVVHVGEYLEIDRPRRLVFTFAVPQFDAADTTVALTFAADGDSCVVTLHHTGVSEEWAKSTVEGWTMILAGLDASLG